MNRNYIPAIDALQVALRAEPEDPLTWLRLGEAYFKAGRHSAALKALERSQELGDKDDWVCSYFVAEVYRQTGQYEAAVTQLEAVLSSKPTELSVLASLAHTYLDLGRSELSDGFVARAERSFIQSVRLSLRAISDTTGFRAVIWKPAADALHLLSTRDAFCDLAAVKAVLLDVRNLLGKPSSRIVNIISLPSQEDIHSDSIGVLEVTIATYDHRVELGSSEAVAMGSAWFDFSVALRSLAQRLPPSGRRTEVITQTSKSLIAAIRTDPMNDVYWVALGDVNFVEQPKTAQHAYIKALEIDSKVFPFYPYQWLELTDPKL